MANRLKKIMQPILKQKCSEAFKAGFSKGLDKGWENKLLSYENEIEFLKKMLRALTKEEKSMSKLKPCKFCGGEPECYRTVIDTEHGYSDAVAVKCLACKARTSYILFDARKHPNGEEYEEAEKLWNRGAVAQID